MTEKPKIQFGVREYTRKSGYFIYVNPLGKGWYTDYHAALEAAIEHENKSGIKTWVECII